MSIILKFEWLYFIRQPMLLIALLLYFLMGSYGIYSGHRLIKNQLRSIDSVKAGSKKDLINAIAAFSDTATAEKKYQAKHAGDPYIIDYRMPRIVIDLPKPLAALSIGLRDMTPVSDKVSFGINYRDQAQEITNPMVLYEGGFDLTFVLLYLLPLVVIIFSYNLLSAEREQGTYSLLLAEGVSLKQLVAGKLLFRFLVICGVTILLNLLGITLEARSDGYLSDSFLWLLVVLTYLAFWFSVVYLVIVLAKSSMTGAISLLGIWILVLFLLPAIVQAFTNLSYPTPLRVDIDDKERHIGEEVWFSPPAGIVRAYYASHPEYAKAYDPADTTNNQNDAFFAGYDYLKNLRMLKYMRGVTLENDRSNSLARKLLIFSPAQQTGSLLNVLSGTSRPDYVLYKQEVAAFQKQWAKCFYDRVFSMNGSKRQVKSFTPKELKSLMQFKTNKQPTKCSDILIPSLSIWIVTAINAILALLFTNKKSSY